MDMGRGASGGVVPAAPLPFPPGPGAQSLGPRGASETCGRENWLIGGASHLRSKGSKRSVSLVTQIRAQAKYHSGWEGCGPSSCIQLVPQNPLSHLPVLPTHQACPTSSTFFSRILHLLPASLRTCAGPWAQGTHPLFLSLSPNLTPGRHHILSLIPGPTLSSLDIMPALAGQVRRCWNWGVPSISIQCSWVDVPGLH